jgi:hypothetical protein
MKRQMPSGRGSLSTSPRSGSRVVPSDGGMLTAYARRGTSPCPVVRGRRREAWSDPKTELVPRHAAELMPARQGRARRYSRAGSPPLDLIGRHVLDLLTRAAAGDLLSARPATMSAANRKALNPVTRSNYGRATATPLSAPPGDLRLVSCAWRTRPVLRPRRCRSRRRHARQRPGRTRRSHIPRLEPMRRLRSRPPAPPPREGGSEPGPVLDPAGGGGGPCRALGRGSGSPEVIVRDVDRLSRSSRGSRGQSSPSRLDRCRAQLLP